MKIVRAMRIGIGVLGMVAMGTWSVPAWAQGGAGEVGSSGGSGNQSSSGGSQQGQEMMHQERMQQQGIEKDQGDQQQKQGETSLDVSRPDRNDQSNPSTGDKNIPNDQKRGQ